MNSRGGHLPARMDCQRLSIQANKQPWRLMGQPYQDDDSCETLVLAPGEC